MTIRYYNSNCQMSVICKSSWCYSTSFLKILLHQSVLKIKDSAALTSATLNVIPNVSLIFNAFISLNPALKKTRRTPHTEAAYFFLKGPPHIFTRLDTSQSNNHSFQGSFFSKSTSNLWLQQHPDRPAQPHKSQLNSSFSLKAPLNMGIAASGKQPGLPCCKQFYLILIQPI